MAWSTNPYATFSQVTTAMDMSQGTQTYDQVWIQELLTEAQDAIDRELGFSFQFDGTTSAPATRTYDGRGMDTLLIDKCQQIVSVTETVYNIIMSPYGIYQNTNPQHLDITNDVKLRPYSAIPTKPGYELKRLSGLPFAEGTANYVVTGIFGYLTVPPDITRATVRTVIQYYKMRDTGYATSISEQGMVHQKFIQELPNDVMQILCRYKPRLFLAW